MTTITQILEGLTDSYQSTGTLNRILQQEELDDYDSDGDLVMKNENSDQASSMVKQKGPKLEMVLEDDEFIPELRQRNEHLLKYLTNERLEQMVDYIICEPEFSDSPSRCFKLPFTTTEVFCTDIEHIQNALFNDPRIFTKLFSFINQNTDKTLNHTLGGYFNKIISFWLIKHTEKVLAFIIKQKNIISNMFNHLYLTSCITDLLIRICTIKQIGSLDIQGYQSLRYEILQHCINSLEHHNNDDFWTEQLFEILSGVVRKCYQMFEPREFFDQLMSPFILQPILEFTFQGGVSSKQGAEFLKILFYNMFIAEPHNAVQDVMEINFGFQLTQIAGVSVDQFKNNIDNQNKQPGDEGQPDCKEENKDKPAQETAKETQSEFSAMKQEELMKQSVLAGANNIYTQHDVNPLLAQQVIVFLDRFDALFKDQHQKLVVRVKLYELLDTLIQLDNDTINNAIKERQFTFSIMEDYERFDTNSIILCELNKLILAISKQTSCVELKVKLFKESQVLFRLAKRLSLSEYSQPFSMRKDIYSFTNQLVHLLKPVSEQQQVMKKLLSECEPNWTALRKAIEDEEENISGQWGEKTLPEVVHANSERKEDVIRKHQEQSTGINLLDKGAASTTKKIVADAVNRRMKLAGMDDAVK